MPPPKSGDGRERHESGTIHLNAVDNRLKRFRTFPKRIPADYILKYSIVIKCVRRFELQYVNPKYVFTMSFHIYLASLARKRVRNKINIFPVCDACARALPRGHRTYYVIVRTEYKYFWQFAKNEEEEEVSEGTPNSTFTMAVNFNENHFHLICIAAHEFHFFAFHFGSRSTIGRARASALGILRRVNIGFRWSSW